MTANTPQPWSQFTPAELLALDHFVMGYRPDTTGTSPTGFENVTISMQMLIDYIRGLSPVDVVYGFATDPTPGASSMCHAQASAHAVGDFVRTNYFDPNKRAYSHGRFQVVAKYGAKNTTTVGKFTNGGSLGALIEGEWFRFAYQPADGKTFFLRPLGVPCVEGVYGWQSRFDEIAAFIKSQERMGATLDGPGVASASETVVLDRVRCNKLPRIQAAPKFFSVAQRNDVVAIEQPLVLGRANHGYAEGSTVTLTSTGTLPPGIVAGTAYYVIPTSANLFEIAATQGGPSIRTTGIGTGVFSATQNGTTLPVATSLRADTLCRLASHGLLEGQELMFGTTGKLPGNISCKTRLFAVEVASDTFRVATSRGGAAIANQNVGQGTHYLYRSPHHASIAFGAPAAPSNPIFFTEAGAPISNAITVNGKVLKLVPGATAAADEIQIGATGTETATRVVNHFNANLAAYGLASVTLYNGIFIGLVGTAAMSASRTGVGFTLYALALPDQAGIATTDRMRWDGKIVRIGWPVRGGINGSSQDWMQQQVEIWGDGEFSLTTKSWVIEPTCGGVLHESDDSAAGMYRYSVHNVYTAWCPTGAAEKHSVYLHCTKVRWVVDVPVGSSMDTLNVEIHANDFQGLIWLSEGVDTSPKFELDVESRADPARDTSPGCEGMDCPVVVDQTGKASTYTGIIRALNGLNGFLFTGKTNGAGASWRFGADAIHFDSLRLVHGNGNAFDFRAGLCFTGDIFIKNWKDPFTVESAEDIAAYTALGLQPPRPSSCVRIGRPANASGLRIHGENIDTTEGLTVGYVNDNANPLFAGPRADGLTYRPTKANLGHIALKMGAGVPNDASPTFAERADRGIPATPKVGWRIANWLDCQLDVSGGEGNGVIEAGAQGAASRLTVGHEFLYATATTPVRRYGIKRAPTAVCEVGIPTLSTAGMMLDAA